MTPFFFPLPFLARTVTPPGGQTALGEILPALKAQNPFGKLSVQGGKRDGVPEATERFGSGGLVKHVYTRHQLVSYCHPLPEIFLIFEYIQF